MNLQLEPEGNTMESIRQHYQVFSVLIRNVPISIKMVFKAKSFLNFSPEELREKHVEFILKNMARQKECVRILL